QTFSKVLIDLHSCQGMEVLYVMLSHATCLNGLLILCPFSQFRITCQQFQDTREEMI
ncbi:hypothetical protein BKA93DRAFT_729383, partial [Sparassis latifolia]